LAGPFHPNAPPTPRGGVGRRRCLAALPLLLPAAACVSQPPAGFGAVPAPVLPSAARERVALLLPLSGQNRQLGQAMLNAAQLALFDQGDPGIELLPRDTGGTAAGAAEAARAALAQGARSFAGPLTLTETASAAQAVRSGRASMLAFTNDASQAGGGVWVLGLTPAEQAERITAAAAAAGARRFGLLAPADELGRRLSMGMQTRLSALGLPAPVVLLRPPRGDAAAAARDLAAQAGPEGLDAVLLGESGASAKAAAAALASALPTPPRFLGTALWTGDAALAGEPALADAWFPAPDPAARAGFESRYMTVFGEKPPRIAAVAYDATALAGRAARFGSPPVGEAMMGADGPIRLLPGGMAQRGLAIFALDASGQPRLVQPAPVPGAAGS
jgi:ABC-type branched-subunit amino acid transport system substrate-binding protein